MLVANAGARRALREVEAEISHLERHGFAAAEVAAVAEDKLQRAWMRAGSAPFYRDLVHRHQRQALASVSLTPKSVVRQAPGRFVTEAGRSALRYYETSGTTAGQPIAAPRTVEDVVWNTVTLARAWRPVLPAGAPTAILLPSDVSPVGDTVAGACDYLGLPHVRCYPFSTGICDFERVEGIMRRLAPQVLFTAPGVLLHLMRALKRRGSFGDCARPVVQVMLLGEVATPALRGMLAQQWGARVHDASYGSTETGTIAATCAHGRLHLLPHAFVAEVAAAEGDRPVPATPGTCGQLVVTPLNTHALALLRYATGDTVELDEGCRCGGVTATLVVRGRDVDALAVAGEVLDVSRVEGAVYAISGVTGYLLEVRDGGRALAVVLERDVDCEASDGELAERARSGFDRLGVALADVRVVHQLPTVSKSGGARKNWKRTNVSVVD